jgi:MFS family permease
VFHELRVGTGFLFTDSDFSFAALALTAGIFAAGCFSTLAPVYVRDLLQRGPSVLGMIGSLIAAGTVAGTTGLSSAASKGWVRGCDPRRLIGGGMAGVGASILLIAAVPTEVVALAGSAGIGLSVAVVMVAASVMLQGEAPAELRGRISGALASLTSLAQLAAMLLAGVAAARWGIRGVFLLSAALLFATGIGAFLGGRRGSAVLELNKIDCACGGQNAPQVVNLT